MEHNEWVGMGFDDVPRTYKIVRVSEDEDLRIFKLMAQIYVLGTCSWREILSVSLCNLSNNHAFADGEQHWLVFLPDHSIIEEYSVYVLLISRKLCFTRTLSEHRQSKYI